MNTLDQVKAIIGDAVGLPASDVQQDANLGARTSMMTNGTQHLDLDSLDKLELVMAFEERFNIDIADDDTDLPELGTPAGIAAYIDRRLSEQSEAIDVSLVETVADTPVVTDLSVRFRKKPVEIEAVEFKGVEGALIVFNRQDVPAWMGTALAGPEGEPGAAWLYYGEDADNPTDPVLVIGTTEGNHIAQAGDWIIRGVEGEIYPCKASVFAATYDPVTDDGADAHEPL